jgi:hypothetical protein
VRVDIGFKLVERGVAESISAPVLAKPLMALDAKARLQILITQAAAAGGAPCALLAIPMPDLGHGKRRLALVVILTIVAVEDELRDVLACG